MSHTLSLLLKPSSTATLIQASIILPWIITVTTYLVSLLLLLTPINSFPYSNQRDFLKVSVISCHSPQYCLTYTIYCFIPIKSQGKEYYIISLSNTFLASFTLTLPCCLQVTGLRFLRCSKNVPLSGFLHFLFFLSGIFFSDIFTT